MTPERFDYGPDPSQYAELTRPAGGSRGVVVVIHGGFWKARYDAELGRPLAADLAAHGWTAWNIEYRRVGNGGGFPETLDDVAAALARLDEPDVHSAAEPPTLITLGHSAGGHLATWAAGRRRQERWRTGPAVTAVISQAGVLDLRAAARDRLGDDAARRFMGGHDDAWALADPRQQLPLGVPVHCVHGRDDDVVPISQSEEYVAAAGEHGCLHPVDGDHFVVIDPASDAWRLTLGILDGFG